MTTQPINLAILIGVTEYTSLLRLPGCDGDIDVMKKIVEGTERFTIPLTISGSVPSQSAKSQLADFIKQHSETQIGEVFFYYSGHGDASNDDFLFLFSDYDSGAINQTTLSNKELDGMLKSLNPQLAVKVIDACHSGVAYIKAAEMLSATFDKSKGQFKNCYFMFSSQTNESSWQDNAMSYFTSAFKDAVLKHTSGKIRYKDIIDAISDAFQSGQRQTPYFTNQADFTEIFCHDPSKLQLLFNGNATPPTVAPPQLPNNVKSSLLELVEKDAARYSEKEEIAEQLRIIGERMQAVLVGTEIESLYSALVEREDASEIPRKKVIADWFEKNRTDYFVDFTYEQEEYQTYVDPPPLSTGSMMRSIDYMAGRPQISVTRKRNVVSSVIPTVKMEYQALVVKLSPKFPNLTAWQLHLFPLFSKVRIRVFYCFVRMVQKGWDELKRSSTVEWKTKEEEIKSGRVAVMAAAIGQEFVDVVTKQVSEAFAKGNDPIKQ